jgi:hypothetical protein
VIDIEDDAVLLQRAVFGKQVENFWASDVGRYLQTKAQERYNAAIDQLRDVDPEDAKEIRRIQNEIKFSECFVGWLNEALREGLEARTELTERDD